MKPFGFGMMVRNVNEALPIGLQMVKDVGQKTSSRGLSVIRVPGPVTTVYQRPEERVLFDPVRDANPFFHLFEALWIIAGSNTLALPKFFLNRYGDFSDDGVTLHGAYGYRLRHYAGINVKEIDQIAVAIQLLKDKPDTRQCVLSIWDPSLDLGTKTKDMPCNDLIMLDITDGRLNMTVCNRSNDVIWGAYGANVVQFSMLQEFIAISVGVERGYYVQQSNNYHVYEDNPYWLKFLAGEEAPQNPYVPSEPGGVFIEAAPMALNELDAKLLEQDAKSLCERAERGDTLHDLWFTSSMGQRTLAPALLGYKLYKEKRYDESINALDNVAAPDWRAAMSAWVARRVKAGAA